MTHLFKAIQAAVKAGNAIMEIYHKDFTVDYKEDESPLTEADRKADAIIQSELKDTFPIISEESKALPFETRKNWETCWLVDPLDGTKEFIKKNDEFTVNIALIKKGHPVMGIVYLPVFRQLYFGSEQTGSIKVDIEDTGVIESLEELIAKGQNLKDIELPEKFTIVASRSHMSPETEKFIKEKEQEHGEIALISKGSSIKLCLVAEGKANVYPRVAPTMEWDTAAAHGVAKYAGCKVLNFYTREELTYNKENLLNPHFIVIKK